jgi:phosphatidylserine decarboxylase
MTEHYYVDRETGCSLRERPFADWIVNQLYCGLREESSRLYRLLTSRWFSSLLGWANYDFPLGVNLSGIRRFLKACNVNLDESLDGLAHLDSARKVFERRIRYWECRPMSENVAEIVSPADSRVLLGSLRESSSLFLKGKFFEYEELLGSNQRWLKAFRHGDFIICRLTPDKYHYNHTPVAGIVRDFYITDGQYHSCNPTAVLTLATPYSKNKRAITILDTDVPHGTGVGLVAMIEIVALMIGDIQQCYSVVEYRSPQPVETGIFVERGSPKSLFRPGSSTTVLLFQQDRVEFSPDLIRNLSRTDVKTRYSQGFDRPLVETDVKVRSTVGQQKRREASDDFE